MYQKAARLADIGSDHAYLPVALMLKGKIEFAVAGEVVKGPFESAKRQVMKNGLSERIEVRLANGLDAIERQDQINAITIAGMGGSFDSRHLRIWSTKPALIGRRTF